VLLAGVGGYYVISSSGQAKTSPTSQPSSTQSAAAGAGNTGSGGPAVTIVSDNLTVGFHAGIWAIEVQNSGSKPMSTLTIILNTPQQTKVCTGTGGGLAFLNCPAAPNAGGPIPPGGTITGFASGAGPGSTTAGNSYTLNITAGFTDGTSASMNATVTAKAAS
jgi:hypothetical protein